MTRSTPFCHLIAENEDPKVASFFPFFPTMGTDSAPSTWCDHRRAAPAARLMLAQRRCLLGAPEVPVLRIRQRSFEGAALPGVQRNPRCQRGEKP